ncbi:MAG: HNH endonuclease [Candidatus Hodarchaeota archaeon]
MAKKSRVAIPKNTKRNLFLYCRHECCLCDKKVSGAYESNIHHINNDPNDNRFENLILLCPNCHSLATRGDFDENHLKTIRDAKICKLGIKEFLEKSVKPEIEFETIFKLKLENLYKLLDEEGDYLQINDLIDEMIMLIKERIEKWDVPSVRFSTEEIFLKLYKYSEKNGLRELYTIFKDLFNYAYSQRKYILDNMIRVFNLILFSSWAPDYDVEKGEKAAKVMLRLGIDFLNRDLTISEDCLAAIDNLAGDMFEPEILSKEILLGAEVFQKMNNNQKLNEFLIKIVDWIRINDKYAWDADNKTYLKSSIEYAEWEQEKYNINIKAFKQYFLIPALEQNIFEDIQGYIEFLGELKYEGDEDITFPVEELTKMIIAYKFIRPNIAIEIRKKIIDTNDPDIQNIFKRIVDSNNFLKKIYDESEMIINFNDLVRFFKNNSDLQNLNVGVTTFGFSWINFSRRLISKEKEALEKIAKKYKLHETVEYELTDEQLYFLMDNLVYLGNNKNNMKKLLDFLDDINSIIGIKCLVTGIEFSLIRNNKI